MNMEILGISEKVKQIQETTAFEYLHGMLKVLLVCIPKLGFHMKYFWQHLLQGLSICVLKRDACLFLYYYLV